MAAPHTLPTKLVRVPHLNGTSVSYHLSKSIVGSKPTLVLIPSLMATATTLIKQVTDKDLLDNANLVVFEPLGHGSTKVVGGETSWTYWDTATCFLQAMDALNIKRAFVLGISQGGFIAARMGLYAPDRIFGIISIGSNFDSPAGLAQTGSADLTDFMLPVVTELTASQNPDFVVPDDVVVTCTRLAIGNAPNADVELWTSQMKKVYVEDTGRLKLRQSIINLLSRDGLYLRLAELKYKDAAIGNGLTAIPFLCIHGSEDGMFSKTAVEEQISALKKAGVEVQAHEIQGGPHASNWTHPDEVNKYIVDFIRKYGGKKDARALREAVGMVDI